MADENPAVPEDKPISIEEDKPISIEGEAEGGPPATGGIRAIGAAARGGGPNIGKSAYKRTLNLTGQGATRCRVFRTRIAAAALEHMEGQINDWLDGENIEVKQVGHMIGTMEGKTPEPNVIVMVWY
jgi:hypothetical protein